ncbi:hypothetical protein [Calorimonas adulescens]|jgi:hypothetical protein|uniref:Uncharacterized protein n=1 Tax=Calorimonas adulescens TaxID=2606906 RepID=A0A5D8QIS9_9THEO|nr:hypothetical protein [Calorimonas adulescens]TZE83403.1 hypothetical protein FWJ32_00515 [Calorimonas adulescens]
MNRTFRNVRFSRRNIKRLIGFTLVIIGAAVAIINIPVWFWFSMAGIIILIIGLLFYNQK